MINYLIYLATVIGIYGILSLSLNFQYGLTGLSNFGHVVFFMLGAYISAIMTLIAHLPFPVGLLGAMAVAGLFGFLISIPTANLKEDYWAITTLAAAEIIRLIFLNQSLLDPYHGASFGIGGIPQPLRSLFSIHTYPLFYLGLVLLVLGMSYFILSWLSKAPFGRVLKAIREGDELPEALGKDTAKFKMKVMAIGGIFGGIAGSLYAHFVTFIDPFAFQVTVTFIIWAMVVVGGRGNHLGALVGTVVVQAFYSSTRFLKDYLPIDPQLIASLRMVLIGILIILTMLFMQQGLVRERKRTFEALRGQDADR